MVVYIRVKDMMNLPSVTDVFHRMLTKFQFIPLQDFTSNSDINWSRSISEIDTQLYAKYGLSEDEISFIESMIKPM